jgi:hypothetical protein
MAALKKFLDAPFLGGNIAVNNLPRY